MTPAQNTRSFFWFAAEPVREEYREESLAVHRLLPSELFRVRAGYEAIQSEIKITEGETLEMEEVVG
jgi:hypothetical protein